LRIVFADEFGVGVRDKLIFKSASFGFVNTGIGRVGDGADLSEQLLVIALSCLNIEGVAVNTFFYISVYSAIPTFIGAGKEGFAVKYDSEGVLVYAIHDGFEFVIRAVAIGREGIGDSKITTKEYRHAAGFRIIFFIKI